MNISLSFLASVDPTMESNATHSSTKAPINGTFRPEDDINFYRLAMLVAWTFLFSVGLFGMAANATVIWILGCRMKKNAFTTYVLNLSVADFALLSDIVSGSICVFLNYFDYIDDTHNEFLLNMSYVGFIFTYSTSQFLLTVISIDRCVCLFFPLWHKCHRPPHLSAILCVIVWILVFLISAIEFLLELFNVGFQPSYHQFLLNAVICMPAIFISTTAILIKVCYMSPHQKRGKLLTAILLALLFFLFFAFPLNASEMSFRYQSVAMFYLNCYALIGATLNSAINPVIYFLIGREKTQSRGKIHKAYERLFQEEEEEESCREGAESTLTTYL